MKKIALFLSTLAISLNSLSVISYADTKNIDIQDTNTIIQENMFSQESTVSEEGNYIIIEDDKGITVLDKTLLDNNELINSNDFFEEGDTSYNAKIAYYFVKNAKYVSEYIDYGNAIYKTSGASGITIGLNLTKSISASASTTFNGAVTKSAISSAVGFSVTSSTSVSYTGSYTVPSNAKKATLTTYPLYNKYSYGIYLRGKGSLPDYFNDNRNSIKTYRYLLLKISNLLKYKGIFIK